MEKPLNEYKNRLRNIIVILYWILISIGFFSLMISFFKEINYNSLGNFIVIVIFSWIAMFFLWPIKRLKVTVYIDAIVFYEKGWHPQIEKEYGVAFENIYEFKVKNITDGLNWIVLKRCNGKTIRKLFSFSENELSGFLNILHEKVNTTIS
ncbi:MAG: hypothetical protein H6540_04895 [Bacteroidales bacterium]|nr:hypothetical protein [Bacteroidales bacterium]